MEKCGFIDTSDLQMRDWYQRAHCLAQQAFKILQDYFM